MEAMAQTSSANARLPNQDRRATLRPAICRRCRWPNSAHAAADAEHRHCAGKVDSKPVNTELRFYGNVQVDERRQAYVQTRFAGWIRKVYADATGNFIGKGQPLFTIYSPDLVSTEHEYLLAKKNSESLQQSKVSGVASGASSLFSAAKERLLQWEVSPAEIEKLDQGGKAITDLTVNSPVSGYITQKNALPNMYVQPETRCTPWLIFPTFGSSPRYSKATQARSSRVIPQRSRSTRIPAESSTDAWITSLPQLDVNTRTLPVRLVFANPGLS